jgi:hypothetical protein
MRTRAALAVILLLSVSLVACGKSKAKSSSSTSTTASASAAASELTVTGKEYEFDGAANTVQAGLVKLSFQNAGTQDHQMQLLRLKDGKTIADFGAAGAADKTGFAALQLVDSAAGLNAVKAGTTETGVSNLKAGNWLMVCFVPAPDGVPHLAKGMIKPFVVTAPASTAKEPAYGATVGAKEYSYTLPTFKAGKQTVEFKNNSTTQDHEMTIVKLAAGKTINDVRAFFATPSGPPPFESAGGAPAVGPGESAFADLDFTAGNYIALCHVPDINAPHQEHAVLGMLQPFTVT